MKIYVLKSRYPISHDIRKKISTILHEQRIRSECDIKEISGLFYEPGSVLDEGYDYSISDNDFSSSLSSAEYHRACLVALSDLLATDMDRIKLSL